MPWKYDPYPGEAGESVDVDTTFFEKMRTEQHARGEPAYWPFQDEEEWGLVKWLMSEVTQGGIDRYAKLPIVSICHPACETPACILTFDQDPQSDEVEFQEQEGVLQKGRQFADWNTMDLRCAVSDRQSTRAKRGPPYRGAGALAT